MKHPPALIPADPRDLQVSGVRLPWAPATSLRSGAFLPEGWALPGGQRTADFDTAFRTATTLAAFVAQHLLTH